MPSGPTLFDDEDASGPDLEPVGHEPAEFEDQGPDASQVRSRNPNFLFRRAIVVGGVVAVLATASIVVGQLIGSGGAETSSGALGAEWNRIVLVDDSTGRVVVGDTNGEELARIESGVRNPAASAAVDSTLVVAGTDMVAVVDIASETIDEFELGADRIVGPAGSALTLIAPQADGGRALLVHGPSGDTIDTDTFAPVVGARYEFADSRSSASGREVLVTDSGNFQSVLFSFDRDEPSFFPGLALAVDADTVVTAQNVGNDATINVFDHDGEPIATGRTPSVRAGMITDSGVILVTVDGAVVTMSPSSGETSDGAQINLGTIESGDVTTSSDRLVVTGANGVAIIGGDGAIIGTYDAQRPAGAGQPPVGSTCIATITAGDVTETQLAVIDATDGSVRVEGFGDEPLLADASGCVVGAQTATGFDLLTGDRVQPFRTNDTLLALTLDGASVVAERDGRTILFGVGVDAEADEPIDLGPQGRTVHITQS